MAEPVCVLLTSDGVSVAVPSRYVRKSKTIDNMLSDIGADEDTPIPVPIDQKTLLAVVQFLKEEDDLEFPPVSISPLGEQRSPMEKIIDAANFLDIQELLDLACQHVAAVMDTLSVDELRVLLGEVDDLTEEEHEDIEEELQWLDGGSTLDASKPFNQFKRMVEIHYDNLNGTLPPIYRDRWAGDLVLAGTLEGTENRTLDALYTELLPLHVREATGYLHPTRRVSRIMWDVMTEGDQCNIARLAQ